MAYIVINPILYLGAGVVDVRSSKLLSYDDVGKIVSRILSNVVWLNNISKLFDIKIVGYEIRNGRRLKLRAYVAVDGTIYPLDL
jgi:hypothetical protein